MELKVTDDYRRAEEGVRSEAVKEAYRFKQEVEDGVYRWGVENGYGEEAEERREVRTLIHTHEDIYSARRRSYKTRRGVQHFVARF